MTEQEYLNAIDAESHRRGFTDIGESLVGLTGPEPWLEAWRRDPSLTPEQQVQGEIEAARESM